MAFDESVTALLKTYDNCLALLKAFKRQRKQDDSGRKINSRASEKQALLKRSLRANREKVERAYSLRVAEAGIRFEKGDSKAKSALGKVLKRLNAAITSLIRLASHGRSPSLDYQSLMALSNSSRLQAIKTFDQLSHRLDTKSARGSAVSATSTALVSTTATSSTSKAVSKTSKTSSQGKSSSKPAKSSSSKSKKSSQGSHSDKKAKAAKESSGKADIKVDSNMKPTADNKPAKIANESSKADIKVNADNKPATTPRKQQKHVSLPPPALSQQQPQTTVKPSSPTIEAKAPKLKRHVSLPPPPPPKPQMIMPPPPPPPPPVPPKDDNRTTTPAAATAAATTTLPRRNTTISINEEVSIDAALRRSAPALRRQPSNATNRFSIYSFSSGSTRLGEIPQSKWRRNLPGTNEDEDDTGYYNVPVMYPLRPYEPPVKERRFLGLFKRTNTT
ncbi:hypothetical protein BD289DRAFT_438953 [Coniella lustricola]|uniref:Uncharacterized protein n=1 Tax=Coniella lustricola TaxID=2025994 RepID=A0A2T3A257_9PEZI|nr:hypothetical protein BD289DRAFT_438953 [Coniella lustricola]